VAGVAAAACGCAPRLRWRRWLGSPRCPSTVQYIIRAATAKLNAALFFFGKPNAARFFFHTLNAA
jgi:hypothetical protein